MYEKPRVERFGSFRELTRIGWSGSSDGLTVAGVTGCQLWGDCAASTSRS